MTLGRIWEHEIAYAIYGPFVKICGRDLFNPTDDTYFSLGFEVLPELEPLEGYHTAWRVATRVIPEEYVVQVPHEETVTHLVPVVKEEPTENEEVTEGEEVIEEPTENEEPEIEYEEVTETIITYTEETRVRDVEEEYIEAYYEEDPEPEDPEEKKRREEKQRRDYWYANFFQTSLGWVRKKATMKDGTVDDFLTQDLPLLAIGLGQGAEAKVIVYATPDFTQEINILALQSYVDVTPQFIMECLLEKQNEFKSLTI